MTVKLDSLLFHKHSLFKMNEPCLQAPYLQFPIHPGFTWICHSCNTPLIRITEYAQGFIQLCFLSRRSFSLVYLLFLSLHLCATKTCIFNIADCLLPHGKSSLTIMVMEYYSSIAILCMYFYLWLYCMVGSKNRLGLFWYFYSNTAHLLIT